MSNQQWTLHQAFVFFIGSICTTLLVSIAGYFIWVHFNDKRINDPKNHIFTIIQTGSEKEALKTVYLAEIIGLSSDSPTSLYVFNCKAAEKKLLDTPLIKSANVKRIPPNAILIDYEIRKPIALIADYKNIAIDREGHLFPFFPFFSPKELPELYLGLPPFGAPADQIGRAGGMWGVPLTNDFWHLGLDILCFLEEAPWKESFRVKRIDVSNALMSSLGQREIVLFTEEELNISSHGKEFLCTFPKILRLSSKDFKQQLSNFFVLRRNMEEAYRKQSIAIFAPTRFSPRIVDLRIPHLAFVENQ